MAASRSAEAEDLQAEVAHLQERITELEAAEQEKRAAEETVQELNANLQALIENTNDFILLSDRQARPVVFNSAYARVMKQLLGLEMHPGIKPHTLLTDPEQIAFWEDCHRRVLVDSSAGQGTTFRVYLPARPGRGALPDCPTPGMVCWQGQGRVLLVDDEAGVRDVARTMLERLGLEVFEARDGAEAIELMRARGAEIDCVLLDLLMPTMDGEETLVALRRIRSDVPVVLSSGYDEDATSGRFAGQTLAGFIQKPYTLGELQDILRGILDP